MHSDITIPWRKPSLPRILFKPFYIKWRHPNPAILSNKNSTIITTQQINTKATWGFPIFRTELNRSSSGHLAKKKKTETQFTSMGVLQLKCDIKVMFKN